MAVYTVSTVLDTPENVDAFVDSNLSSGADHMFVFLDTDLPEVRSALSDRAGLTLVTSTAERWQGTRPDSLNQRQKVHANLARLVLLCLAPDSWLFHIDRDETLDISREALEELDSSIEVVTLNVFEQVSSSRPLSPALYKRLLNRRELTLLKVLDVVDRPANVAYFRGHTYGKTGMRVDWHRAMRTHDVVEASDERVDGLRDPRFNMLHHESVSRDEFVAKWLRFRDARASFRPSREQTRQAVAAVVENNTLTRDQAEWFLTEIYKSTVEDPVDILEKLGYLIAPDPGRHRYAPRDIDPVQRTEMRLLTDQLMSEPPNTFYPRTSLRAQRAALLRAARALGEQDHVVLSEKVYEVASMVEVPPPPRSTKTSPWTSFTRRLTRGR